MGEEGGEGEGEGRSALRNVTLLLCKSRTRNKSGWCSRSLTRRSDEKTLSAGSLLKSPDSMQNFLRHPCSPSLKRAKSTPDVPQTPVSSI